MRAKRDKKLVMVSSDLLEKAMKIANKEGKTITTFVNDLLEQAIRAHEMKLNLRDCLELCELLEVEKKAGAVITIADTWRYLVEKLYPKEKDALLERWRKAGEWYGKYLSTRFYGQDQAEVFRRLLKSCRWELSEVDICKESGVLRVRCVAPSFSNEDTELFSKFLEGVASSMNYELMKEDSLRGIIYLEFKERSRVAEEVPRG
jgi:hypothetical protein